MLHSTEWVLACSRFEIFRKNLPVLIDENCVQQYHAILESLANAGGLDLDRFKIDVQKIAFRMVRTQTADIYPPHRAQYSNKKYCDADYFGGKLGGLADFLDRSK